MHAIIMVKDMNSYCSAEIIDELTYQRELDIWKTFAMELEGFGTLSDSMGNHWFASKFALGKNHGNRSYKQGLI
jgi:hypothetical protein